MKFFADQGLNTPIDDVWAKVKGNYTEASRTSVVGNDGKVYGIPVDYYPWAVFYRKSVFADKGYTVPTTWDDLKTLCTKMQADGLTPIAFGDKDGWPAMGTFDILNLRHQRLRLPCRPDGRQGEVDRPEGHRGLPEVGGDPSVPRQGLRRPDLAERGRHARPEEVRACTCSACSSRRSSRRPRTRPTSTTSTSSRSRRSGTQFDAEKRARRADRHLAARGQVAEPRGRD